MICTMIDNVEKYLPQDEVLIFSLCKWLRQEHIVPQFRKIFAHLVLHVVPVCANDVPIVESCRVERRWDLGASQPAEPGVVNAHEMQELITDRPARVGHMLG